MQVTSVGKVIATLMAIDHDLSGNGLVVYSMEQLVPIAPQGSFTVNQFTGDLVLALSLDLQTTYQIRVIATVSSPYYQEFIRREECRTLLRSM